MIIGNLILAVLSVPFAIALVLLVFWGPATFVDYFLEKKMQVQNKDTRMGWSIAAGFATCTFILMLAVA